MCRYCRCMLCMWVSMLQIRACVHAYEEARGQTQVSFLRNSPSCFMKQGLSLEPGFSGLGQANWPTNPSCSLVSPPTSTGFTNTSHMPSDLQGSGDGIQALMLLWQALYQWSHRQPRFDVWLIRRETGIFFIVFFFLA